MNKYDLSILIPARNEMFLAKTVEDILKNKRGKTEIIVHLDGKWANPGIPDHPDLTIIYSPEPIGQRAGTNKACRLSKAKYVMKADAHLSFDEGFDVKLMAAMQDDITIVPMMRNLHVFDWVCVGKEQWTGSQFLDKDQPIFAYGCGYRFYQGPTPSKCEKCGGNMVRQLLWKAKESPRSTAFTFDKTLHFQYFNEFKKRPEGQGELTETMSIQGSCFMLTRQKYWELDICEENFGSWGQQGVEVACKTWFSGGRVMCLQTTWYAHMFRTQGGDFSFPYQQSGRQIDHARKYSRELFEQGKWQGAKDGRNLEWLLQKFYPVPYWHDKTWKQAEEKKQGDTFNIPKQPTKGIIFFTDNEVNVRLAHKVQNQLRKTGLPIVSSSLKPMPHFGKNIHIKAERGYLTMFRQIIAALEASETDIIFMCEHDVLYHPSHFDFTPEKPDKFYYNINFWKVWKDGLVAHWDANQVSGLCAYREHLLDYYKARLQAIEISGFNRSYEPGGRDASQYEQYSSAYPNIDIRRDNNLTRSHRSPADFRDKSTCINWQQTTIDKIEGWGSLTLADFYK
jgi:glycosyltransferase involved in cell wall biosynthesis